MRNFLNTHKISSLPPDMYASMVYLCTYLNDEGIFEIDYQKDKNLQQNIEESVLLYRTCKNKNDNFYERIMNNLVKADGNKVRLLDEEFLDEFLGEWYIFEKNNLDLIVWLYEHTPKAKRKNLGYLFKLMPYVNKDFNYLCKNPAETDFEKLKILNLNDALDICGCKKEQSDVLISVLQDLKYELQGKLQEFIVCYKRADGDYTFFINPNIFYSGCQKDFVNCFLMYI